MFTHTKINIPLGIIRNEKSLLYCKMYICCKYVKLNNTYNTMHIMLIRMFNRIHDIQVTPVLQWLPVTALALVYFSCRGHAEVRTDNKGYVTYEIGNVNIVISVPHGGRLKVNVATCFRRRCCSSTYS